MEDLNSVAFTGNLVRDAEVRTFGTNSVLNFSIACNRTVKVDNEWVEKPSYFDVSYWSKGAEKLAGYLKKGTSVALQGHLDQQTWEKDGQKHSKLCVVAERLKWYTKGDVKPGTKAPTAAQAVADAFGGDAFPEDIF